MRELEGKGFDLISLNVHGSLIFHSSAGHPVVQTVLQVRRADVTPAPHSTRTYTRIHTRTHTRRCGTVSVWFGSSVSGFGVCLRPACRRVQAAAVQSAGWDDREQPLSPSSTGARLWRVRVEQSAPVGSLPPPQPCHVGRAVPTHAPFSARGSERRAPMTAAETGEGVRGAWGRPGAATAAPGSVPGAARGSLSPSAGLEFLFSRPAAFAPLQRPGQRCPPPEALPGQAAREPAAAASASGTPPAPGTRGRGLGARRPTPPPPHPPARTRTLARSPPAGPVPAPLCSHCLSNGPVLRAKW